MHSKKNNYFKNHPRHHADWGINRGGNRRDRWRAHSCVIWLLPVALLLSACGGGGSSSGGAGGDKAESAPSASSQGDTPPTLPDVPEGWETDPEKWAAHEEYRGQQGLAQVKAAAAYGKGITGQGVTIGFVDTGLEDSHVEFADKTIRLNDRTGLEEDGNRQLRHGTGVASIALGARSHGNTMHGVAFDADPAMWSLKLDSAGYLAVNDDILTRATRALQDSGARIINQSWGYATLLEASLGDAQRRFLSTSYGDFIDEMRRGEAIHVWSAGNSGGD